MDCATDKSKEPTEAGLEKQGEETLAEVCDMELEFRRIYRTTDKKILELRTKNTGSHSPKEKEHCYFLVECRD